MSTGKLWVCRSNPPNDDFLYSVDGGATWLTSPAPQNDSASSIMGSGPGGDIWTPGGGHTGGVWRNVARSIDGVTWASEDPGLMTNSASVIAVLPNGTVFCGDYLGQLYQRSPGGVWSLAFNTGFQSVWRTNAVVISNDLVYLGCYERFTTQMLINRWAFGFWGQWILSPSNDKGFGLAGYGNRLWMTTWNNSDNKSRIWGLMPSPSGQQFQSDPAVFDPTIPGGEAPLGGWAASETEVWFPGRAGNVAVTTNGVNWTIQNVGTAENLRCIWGFGSTEVFVCGASGGIYKWDGTGWSQIHSGPGVLRAMWGIAPPPPPPPSPIPEPGLRSPLKIYPFFIESIRDADRDDGDLLLRRWTEGMDVQWETIDLKIRDLATLIDPETCPSDAVAFLGWIVGLTKSLEGLTGGISESDHRQLIAIAVRAWKKKGSGLGLVETLKSISGYDVRYLTWFFFRILLDEFELGHAEFDVDPWLLDQPGMTPSVAPDGVDVERILRGDLLPSAADPVWIYVSEGALEGATFSISGERIAQTQTDGDGGRYLRDDAPNLLDPETAEVAAVLRIESKTVVGGTPWFLELEDGVRGYRLRLSDGVVVLQDVDGNVIAGPRSRGFVVGTEYLLRIVRTGPTTVDATIDGSSVFGEREISDFAASANERYGFGYRDEGVGAQDWVVSWREVGPKPILKFDLSTLLGLTEAVPHDVRVVYRENVGRTSTSYWTGSRNEVSVDDALGVPIPLEIEIENFRVGVDPDEFVSDLRVVDDGTLDRDFVARLVGVLRPAGERIFVRFVDFQDVFRNRDLRYWDEISGTTVPRPDDGRADLEDVGAETVIHADMPLSAVWRQFTLAAQFALRDPVVGNWGEVRFHVADALNFYAVRIDPGARTVALQRVIAGVRTTMFTHGPMDVFHLDVLYMVHVTTEDVVGGVLMKVYLDGNHLGEAIDAAFDEGTVGLAVATGQRLSVSFVDLVACPFPSARVGPGIDADPTWNSSCANP